MPYYDLRCTSCDKEWEIKASIEDKTNRIIPCPQCGSTDLETVYSSAPYFIRGGGPPMPSCPSSSSCGASCPHARGA